eukprot:jgi/Phyca11/554723/estExt2_Genewise1Plus.C_PHYCAscaffold_640195
MRTEVHTNSQNGSTLDSRSRHSTSQQQTDSKAKPNTATVHQPITPQQEKHSISACSAEANHTANRTLLLKTPQQTNRSPTGHAGSLHNQQHHAFEQREVQFSTFKRTRSRPEGQHARHFTSGTSSTDYTEGRKPSLMYGH